MQPVAPTLLTQADIATTMQPQNMYVSSGNNSSGNTRSNQQSGTFRPPTASNAPRAGGTRHLHMQAMYPNMVLQHYPQYAQRQPTYQASHIQYAPPISFYPYQYIPALPQQPPHSRTGVAVNTNVNIGNTMPVQPGPNGPLAGPGPSNSQMQMLAGAVQPGTNAVIAVGSTGSGQVAVPPMVTVMPASVAHQPAQVPPTNRRRHQHRLKIIDPTTRRNILDDLDKTPEERAAEAAYGFSQEEARAMICSIFPELTVPSISIQYELARIRAKRQANAGQTPVVSAMSDAPSVEILPTPQKNKSKKIPIVSPNDSPEPSAGFSSPKADDAAAKPSTKATNEVNHNMQSDCGSQQSNQQNLLHLQKPQRQPQLQTQGQAQNQQQQTHFQYMAHAAAPSEDDDVIVDETVTHRQTSELPPLRIYTDFQYMEDAAAPSEEINTMIDESTELHTTVDETVAHRETSELPPLRIYTDFQYMEDAAAPSEEINTMVDESNELQTNPYKSAVAAAPSEEINTMIDESTELQTNPYKSAVDLEHNPQIDAFRKPDTTVEIPKGAAHPEIELQSQPPACNETSQGTELDEKVSMMQITESTEVATKTAVIAPAPAISEKVGEPLIMGQADANILPQSSHESTPDETDRTQILLAEETCIPTSETINENPVEKVEKDTTQNSNEHELKTETDVEKVAEVAMESEVASMISYNEGQWSPSNPSGKKQYDREQLLLLREAKASRVQPEVKNVSILPHPNMMPLFMRNNNNNNKRVQSMVVTIGGNRNSESGSNFSGKQVSMSGVQGGRGSSMKGMIHVNLSLNQDVKLNETENAWRPRLQTKVEVEPPKSEGQATHEKDELIRRVRGILNKLTPERFDTLVEEIVKLKIDTPDKMDEVIVLVFEKAIDEPNFSVSYARLCHRLISEVKARDERMESGTKSNLQHFRNALLDKTEKEFTQNVSQGTAKEKKLQPIVDKIKTCTDPNEKAELEALLEEEERKIRRRSGGTVRFIGELFKISMLTGKIIHSCIDTLLNPKSEDMLECLCKLLTTVGAKFEQTTINTKDPSTCYSLQNPIGRMQSIASKTDKDGSKVSSRVRFMLQDVIDLRKNKWQTSRNEAPKTMGQIEKEAKNEQLSAQYMNYSGSLSTSSRNGPQSGSGKRDDRSGARFGDSRSAGGYGGSHSQRGDGSSNMRHQQSNNSGGSGNGNGGGGSAMAHLNGNNDDNTWHVQTSKGSRSQAVDSNKLDGLTLQLSQNLDTKKMGGVDQFIWTNANRQSSTPTTTPSNSFAVLSSLIDKSSTERDRDRDRSGPRNKGSYNKGSMERDRYSDRGIHSRTGSSQGSRENSSSRVGQNQQSRGMMNPSMQKSASHSKYTQQQAPPSRLSNKGLGTSLSSSGASGGGLYRGSDQQQTFSSDSGSISTLASQSAKGVAPQATFTEPRESDMLLFKSVLSEMITLVEASKSVTPKVVECIQRISEPQRCGLLFYILTDYLHLSNVGKQYRSYLATIIAHLIQQNYMSVDHFKIAYSKFSECASDLMFDVPELWLYVLEFAGPLIVKQFLTVSDLWNKTLRENSESSKKFLKTYLTYCTREVGPNFTRNMWKKFNMRWSDFMPDNEVIKFIELNKFDYVENGLKAPVIEQRESPEKHIKNVIDHIEQLLKEGATADSIIDYSNGNIVVADKLFIRGLTQTLGNFSIVYKENSYKLEPEIFQKFCIPVFQRYIDSNEDLQLECLYGVQLLVHGLEHPRGLLSELFIELYDGFVIQKEMLYKWRDSKDQSAGKGVAVKSLNPFFNSLSNDEGN